MLVQLIGILNLHQAHGNFFLGDVYDNGNNLAIPKNKGYHVNSMESVGRGTFAELDLDREGWWKDHPAYHRMLSVSGNED